MDDDFYQWRTNSVADVAHSLSQSVAQMQELHRSHLGDSLPFDSASLTSALQELSLRITQLSSSSSMASNYPGVDLQERNRLSQRSRQLLQEATHQLKVENQMDAGLLNALKGCLVALRSSEHLAAQQLVNAVHPVLQTLSILEKSSTTERLTLNAKLLGMRLTKFLQLVARHLIDLRGPPRRASLQKHSYLVQKVLPHLFQSIDNSIQRPINAYDRAARHLFFNTVKESIESIRKLLASPSDEDLDDNETQVGRFVKTVDYLLDEIDTLKDMESFERVQTQAEWLITFAMSVAKSVPLHHGSSDEKDIINACNHLVNEFGNLKDALNQGGDHHHPDLNLAKEVAKDFIEVTEQSVNSALLRLIVLSLSQLHVPLDRLIHAVLISDKVLPNRQQEDIQDLIEASDTHADCLFHIAHFAVFCTSDATTAQALSNSLHLVQMLEKELVPGILKLYFNPTDVGARSYLKTLRQLWRQELDLMETFILDIVDPTAFCIIVEAEARRIASKVKKDQYSQDCDHLRLSVSQVVRLCQMAVDFAWKKIQTGDEETEQGRPPNPLPEDHAIIRVERSTWEVQAALKKVIANVEDLHQHKALIRRVQLMVTCTTAMVECLMDSDHGCTTNNQSSRVKVLTSVSRINIGAGNKTCVETVVNEERPPPQPASSNGRGLSKSFKNITMNNTIGVSRKNSMQLKAFALTFDDKGQSTSFRICSRKAAAAMTELENTVDIPITVTAADPENKADKELHRKVKLHSYSEGFRSPLKQISNQLSATRKASVS